MPHESASNHLPVPGLLAQQHATRAAFFIPGFAISAWAPLIPFVKARAGLDDAGLGLVLLCLGCGSLLAMPLAGVLAAREGCRKVMLMTALPIALVLPLLALVASPWLLGVILFFFGASMGAMDCTMNLQAILVERDSRRAMMSGFHGFYSVGSLTGAAGMTALLSTGIAQWLAGLVVTLVILITLVLSAPHWRRDRAEQAGPAFALPHGVVAFIGVLCFITFLTEGAMLDWSAVFLNEARGMDPARAGIGFVMFSVTMTGMRLIGDRVVQRLGRHRTVAIGGLVAAAGFLLATTVAFREAALIGYALVGLGCANIVPALFSLAGQQRVMPESLAIPAITTLGYAGVLIGPALIGFVAHSIGLTVAFLGIATAMALVSLSVKWLKI